MKKRRYNFDTTAIIVATILIVIGLISAIIGHGSFNPADPFIISIFVFWLAFICSFMFGTYAELDRTREIFSRTNAFVWKTSLRLDEIKELKYRPTWKVGTANRSLYVIGVHNGSQKIIDFPNLGFSEKTIAAIARDLKGEVRNLRIDSFTEALLAKHSQR
jgi:hypothetical protein